MEEIEGLIALRGWSTTTREDIIMTRIPYYGYRTLDTSIHTLLQSTGMDVTWDKNPFIADKIPTLSNQNGIYAYLPHNCQRIKGEIKGVVELKGQIIEHDDDVLRASWAKIHHLFIPNDIIDDKWLRTYAYVYNCHITLTNNLNKSIEKWVENEGVYHQARNQTLLYSFSRELPHPIVCEEYFEPPIPVQPLTTTQHQVRLANLTNSQVLEETPAEPTKRGGFLNRLLH